MKLALNLPSQEGSDRKPEIRPAKVATWLQSTSERDTTTAARLIGDALASINRASVSDSRRFELTAQYWKTAQTLWIPLARYFVRAPQPLTGEAQDAARAALVLATELASSYKRLLQHESDKRLSLGGPRLMVALVRRALQASSEQSG